MADDGVNVEAAKGWDSAAVLVGVATDPAASTGGFCDAGAYSP
jgi:hypothetical protein